MIRLLQGDVREQLALLAPGSVHAVVTSPPYYALRSYLPADHPDKHREIGSEATPDEFLAVMVEVFRAVRRVLRDDGVCWANMGDSYAGGGNVGWRPGCQCDAATVPCTVLDCFAGAGTTLLVADRLQRDAIGIDLNISYGEMAKERVLDDAPLLTGWRDEPLADGGMADLFPVADTATLAEARELPAWQPRDPSEE
jgi:hypothetical protein